MDEFRIVETWLKAPPILKNMSCLESVERFLDSNRITFCLIILIVLRISTSTHGTYNVPLQRNLEHLIISLVVLYKLVPLLDLGCFWASRAPGRLQVHQPGGWWAGRGRRVTIPCSPVVSYTPLGYLWNIQYINMLRPFRIAYRIKTQIKPWRLHLDAHIILQWKVIAAMSTIASVVEPRQDGRSGASHSPHVISLSSR